MESAVTLSPSTYPFADQGVSYCWAAGGGGCANGLSYPFSCNDGVYEQQRALSSCYPPQSVGSPQIFSVSSPASSSTELTDIQDIFQGSSESACSAFSASLHLSSQKPRSPQALSEKKGSSGKAARVKRAHASSSSNKPYRRTTSPVFPDGAVPIASLMSSVSHQQPLQPLIPSSSSIKNSNPSLLHNKSLSPLAVRIHDAHFVEHFQDIEKKLLQLYSEKSKLVHQLMNQENSYHLETSGDDRSSGELLLAILPTGQSEYDNGFMEEVNSLLLTVGGLYSSYESSVDKLVLASHCSSIGECINSSLMGATDQLLLSEDPYSKSIHIDPTGSLSPAMKRIVDCTNDVLEASQAITKQSQCIQSLLSTYIKKISSYKESLDSKGCSCKEARAVIQSILTGNTVILNSVQKIWDQHCIKASETITCISNALTNL